MRLLVIEDEDKMRSVLRRGLEAAGYAVGEAEDGEAGLSRGLEGGYDAIVLDVLLPDIDGFEVCRRLRRAEVWAPVLMLTALDAVDDRITGLDAGADDYLVKPLRPRRAAVTFARPHPPGTPTSAIGPDVRTTSTGSRDPGGVVERRADRAISP